MGLLRCSIEDNYLDSRPVCSQAHRHLCTSINVLANNFRMPDHIRGGGGGSGSTFSRFRPTRFLPPHFRPTTDHVVATRRLLLRYLPLELADEILDRANYHPSLLETYPRYNTLDTTVCEPTGTQNNEVWCFLITPPIPACENLDWESATDEVVPLRAVKGGQAFTPEENESLQVYAVKKVKRITFWINARGSNALGGQFSGKFPLSNSVSLELTET